MAHQKTSKKKGFARYEEVEQEYWRKRQLHKSATWRLLWGLGVGAAISGHFFGWNFGLAAGGFWGLAIATLLMAIMYLCLVFCIAELSAAFPYAGGFYAFARYTFGPLGGFICGVSLLIQYLVMPAVIVVGIAGYLNTLLPTVPIYMWWLLFYAIFVLINMRLGWSLIVGLVFTILAIVILFIFYVSAIATSSFHSALLFNIAPLPSQSATWLPFGWSGVFAALPFASLFYLAVELLPLAAEETHDVANNMPKALIGGILTLLLLSFFTLIIGSGINGGAANIALSSAPISEGFSAFFRQGVISDVMEFITLIGLIASLQAIIYAYGRVLFALSRAGYFPSWLSITNRNQIPANALILGAAIGLICAFVVDYSGHEHIAVLLNMALFGAVISYIFVFASYIQLKFDSPNLARPYKSPLGIQGAIVGGVLSLTTLVACFSNPDYRLGLLGGLIFLILSILYFVFYSRKRLVAQAPEEKRALKVSQSIKGFILNRIQLTARVFMFIALILTLVGVLSFELTQWNSPCPPDCLDVNLIRKNLSGENLKGANLLEANLREADLSEANLRDADLRGANLLRANLEKADLSEAKLIGANLSGANLSNVYLLDTDMRGANLAGANLTGVDLTQVDLRGVNLSEAELIGSNFERLNMAGVKLVNANLSGAILNEANLSGAILSQADLSGAQLIRSNLSGAWLNLTNLIGANLEQADLSGASLIGANLASANLFESQLVGSILVGVDFNGANLSGANLSAAKLRQTQLRNNALLLDPALTELNALNLNKVLSPVTLSGVQSDSKTKWPESQASSAKGEPTPEPTETSNKTGIKVGILHSLSGSLAGRSAPVHDATLLAINEINAAGGLLGQQLLPVIYDGASDSQIFAERANQLLSEDEVVVVFGCWTSACRKKVKPLFEQLNSLLFYPVQYEGLEQSPNIFYTGAEPTQQIIPAVEYLLNQGYSKIFLLGSDNIFPRTASAIIKAQLADVDGIVAGEVYLPLGETEFGPIISEIQAAQPQAIFNTLNGESNVTFFQQFKDAGFTADKLPVMSVSIAEEEVRQIGAENLIGHLTAWSYYQTLESPANETFIKAYKAAYGQDRVTSDPIHAGYAGVYLWKAMVEKAGSTDVLAVRKAAASEEIEFMAPSGLLRIDGETQHTYRRVRIGVIREDGLIEEISSSKKLIKPDPFLLQYEWATDLPGSETEE